jgi:hypothetical protein
VPIIARPLLVAADVSGQGRLWCLDRPTDPTESGFGETGCLAIGTRIRACFLNRCLAIGVRIRACFLNRLFSDWRTYSGLFSQSAV